jgi:ribosomal protein S27AE
MLRTSGVLKVLKKQYPFESEHLPLYDIEDVERWRLALLRRDGLVAMGRKERTEPLLEALDIPAEHDTVCPRCKGWAIADPEDGKGEQRVWCPKCGVVELDEE